MTVTIELPEDAEGLVQALRTELRAAKHRRADARTQTAFRTVRQMMGVREPDDR
ncbi:hypothetical protein [Microbacterium mangrovi]|uniref:hypothetical protein n=1 Tax=Microbacterium mangrovi TaxID=1348253 RepID=UPI000AA7F239|nr:hypothetical protein [Microbacterium mangrovi]